MENATETHYAPAWVSEPNHRGTWSILYSCVFTLSICVWSAIHLNIPPRGEPTSYQYWRKTKWVFIAIFAPEAVLYSAWQQFYLARRFIREMQNICRDHHKIPRVDPRARWAKSIDHCLEYIGSKVKGQVNNEGERKSTESKKLPIPGTFEKPFGPSKKKWWKKWWKKRQRSSSALDDEIASFSMIYGFYVVMGGFVVYTGDIYDHEDARWLTVTPRGVIEFAQTLPWEQFREHFSIDKGSIKDKSKADCLAKILVIVQVTWAAFNSISRCALGYPISVLEVHTLVHAGCAMLMYALWFEKPLDIRDPNPVNTASFKDELALMLVRSPGSAYWPYADLKLPSRWNRSISHGVGEFGEDLCPDGKEDWPDRKEASEATFLHFHSSKPDTETQGNDATNETYSIIPHLPEVPLENPSNHDNSNNISMTESSPPADGGVLGRLSVRSDRSGEQEIPSPVGNSSAAAISSNYSIAPSRDRIAQQADFEASLGADLQPATPTPSSFEVADISRRPPTIRVQQQHVHWFESIWNKLHPSREPVQAALTLSTGEFLKSGIGPAGFFTAKKPSQAQMRFESYAALASKTHIRFLQELVDEHYRPPQTRLVEVDERLKRFIDIPRPTWKAKPDRRECWKPENMEKTYVHKVSAALSDKDVTRWTRAANAFREEIAEEASADSSKKTSEPRDQQHDANKGLNDDQPVGRANQEDPDGLDTQAESLKAESGPKLATLWKPQKHSEAAISLSEFCYRSRNIEFTAFRRLNETFVLAMYVAMSYISSIYAGIHLALWKQAFPTKAEATLWKMSAIVLGVPAPLFVIACVFGSVYLSRWPYLAMKRVFRRSRIGKFYLWLDTRGMDILVDRVYTVIRPFDIVFTMLDERVTSYERKLLEESSKLYETSKLHKGLFYRIFHSTGIVLKRTVEGIGYAIGGVGIVIVLAPPIAAGLLYCFSRVYIVVESFLSLRHVPVGVYEEVSWAQYIPHL